MLRSSVLIRRVYVLMVFVFSILPSAVVVIGSHVAYWLVANQTKYKMARANNRTEGRAAVVDDFFLRTRWLVLRRITSRVHITTRINILFNRRECNTSPFNTAIVTLTLIPSNSLFLACP